ncbi:MAG: sulfurtransferase TusA family protein [Burkholderiaceae bacterium]|nr:sulfurtransferase TusA family protein [Burkholderiaceae bacterium]
MSESSVPAGLVADRTLDARGLNCPMPILKAKKTLNEMTAGSLLKVLATDPGAVRDFEYFCRHTGHQLLESTEQQGEFGFLIRRKG